jgi:hypothetical protein
VLVGAAEGLGLLVVVISDWLKILLYALGECDGIRLNLEFHLTPQVLGMLYRGNA